mmetsp:Transcript_62447/g.71633  ORF Transcript_62447/g.71633 Transcript_62447/m.71633 type:complete len:343 (-) Transcript_62447:206-1234(-)
MGDKFDHMLLTMFQQCQGVEGAIDSFFSFLYRRTDYFYEMSEESDKMGFPPGVAEHIVGTVFRKYQELHWKERVPRKVVKKQTNEQKAAEGAVVEEIKEEKKSEGESKASEAKEEVKKTEAVTQETKKVERQEPVKEETKKVEEKHKPLDPEVSRISTYNGDVTDKYSWSQALREVTVQIELPEGTKAKNLDVKMTSKKFSVKLKNSTEMILEGDFCETIRVDDSFWNVDDGALLLNLEKATEIIWKSVFKGDQEIDTTKVDNTKKVEDYDDTTQGAIRKIMYEQNRKMRGLKTSDEEKQEEMLRKAWDAEGSPFKGQPFDPSKFNMGGGGGGAQMNFPGNS